MPRIETDHLLKFPTAVQLYNIQLVYKTAPLATLILKNVFSGVSRCKAILHFYDM